MYIDNIVQFETTEKKFLRLISNKISILKNEPQKSAITLVDLLELCLDYIDYLPQHFFELLNLIKDLINNYSYYDHLPTLLLEKIDRILLLCELLSEEPTVTLFKKMVTNRFEAIYEYEEFPEDILYDVIYSLKNISEQDKQFTYSENRLYWLALSNMTLSKEMLMEVVRNFYLKGDDFINFCKDIGVCINADEEVLIALIERIEKQKLSVKPLRNNMIKYQIYITILLTALPSYNVVKKIIKVIFLEDKEYYKFFYMIIMQFGDSKDILNTVIERLNSDEPKRTENVQIYIRRLRLLAMNI